jgi:hypothetical protein
MRRCGVSGGRRQLTEWTDSPLGAAVCSADCHARSWRPVVQWFASDGERGTGLARADEVYERAPNAPGQPMGAGLAKRAPDQYRPG